MALISVISTAAMISGVASQVGAYPTRIVGPHKVVDLPGGLFVRGSANFYNAMPHWVHLSPFSMATEAVTEGQYRDVIGRQSLVKAPWDHPMTYVSHYQAEIYVMKLNRSRGTRSRLPTEAEWEFAARGPAVDLREIMEAEGIATGDFVDFAEGRFENFVTNIAMDSRIFTDPTERAFRRILRTSQELYGWRVHGTPSGRLTPEEAYYSRKETTRADWGPANGYGLKGMCGGVRDWTSDWFDYDAYHTSPNKDPMGPGPGRWHCKVLRGGSWFEISPECLRAAYRNFYSNSYGDDGGRDCGFRVAAPKDFEP